MKGDLTMPRSGASFDEPCRSLKESEWKWVELLRTICDGNVPSPDMNEIRALGETIAGHRRKLI
jgi:hypothetical protein